MKYDNIIAIDPYVQKIDHGISKPYAVRIEFWFMLAVGCRILKKVRAMKKQQKQIEAMDLPKFFELVFCENVFNRSRKREAVDKREAVYLFMRRNLKMGWTEIGRNSGRSHSTVISGVRHFEGLLEVNDSRAKQTWDDMIERIEAVTDEIGLPTIEIAVRVDKE